MGGASRNQAQVLKERRKQRTEDDEDALEDGERKDEL